MGDHQDGRKEDAVALYREILSQQPDDSVTIVTIGYLTNLKGLLASGADQHSERNGLELVREKVKSLICMGGEYPSGKEWNFSQDVVAAQTVVAAWPTPMTFVGYELGKEIITGTSLLQTPPDNPIRLSYQLHNNFKGRPSWDQLALLYAILKPVESLRYFSVSPPGRNTIDSTGKNIWKQNAKSNHRYLQLAISKNVASQLIDDLMTGEKVLPY
jgi:inosine-uridine nucleoside N-ribohydrolase